MINTFWARLLTANKWLFSTTAEQEILTTCKQLADKILKINNTGFISLPHGCFARTGDVRLMANQEFTTTFTTETLEKTYLDVSNILMNINPSYPDLVQKVISNESLNMDIALNRNEHTGTLKLGRDLHDIVERARALGQYNSISGQYSKLKVSVTNMGVLTLILSIVFIATCMGIACWGGPLLLKWKRLIPGTLNQRRDPREPMNLSDCPHFRRPYSIHRSDPSWHPPYFITSTMPPSQGPSLI